MIDKLSNLTINNEVGNVLIEKVTNLTINKVVNYLINKVTNLTINYVRNDSNRMNASDVQVQFAVYPDGISHQNVFSRRKIGIRHKELPVLDPPIEPSIGANNQPSFTISTGVVQVPKALKTPTMDKAIAVTNAYNMGENRNPRRVVRNGIDGTNPSPSNSGIIAVAIYPSPTPPSGCIWNGIIGNI